MENTIEMPNAIGGVLCLDFVNTVDPRHAAERLDFLHDYSALVAWARHVEAIHSDETQRMLDLAKRAPREAARVVKRAVMLREALYRIFVSVSRGRDPATVDRERLNTELAQAMRHGRIDHGPEGLSWGWAEMPPKLDRVLWPVVRSAVDLLIEGPLDRVKECPGDSGTCGWLFLDVSKNAARRWCEMRSCGNRAKARRHYARAARG